MMMLKFKLCPKKKQWRNWSLISKLTAIGTLVGVISFLCMLFFQFMSTDYQNQNEQILSEIKEIKYNLARKIVHSADYHQVSYIYGLLSAVSNIAMNRGAILNSVQTK